jgi:hypothetical protein
MLLPVVKLKMNRIPTAQVCDATMIITEQMLTT